MIRPATTLLVFSSLVCGALAQTCEADAMDLCQDLPNGDAFSCDADAMDLCVDDPTTTVAPVPSPTPSVSTTALKVTVKTGTASVTVDATPVQVKSSFEKAMGTMLHAEGVGSSATEAAGYVVAVVKAARRLSEFTRKLASTTYAITYTITIPTSAATTGASAPSVVVDKVLTNIKNDPTVLQTGMKTQFQAANVASATTITVQGFTVNADFESDTAAAPRLTGKFSTTLLVLLSCFAFTQVFVLAAGLN